MGITFKFFSIFISLFFLCYIFYIFKKNLVRGESVILWFLIGLLILSVPLAEDWYDKFAEYVGLSRAPDLIFLALIGICISYIFVINLQIQKLNRNLEKLVSSVSIIDEEVERLKNER